MRERHPQTGIRRHRLGDASDHDVAVTLQHDGVCLSDLTEIRACHPSGAEREVGRPIRIEARHYHAEIDGGLADLKVGAGDDDLAVRLYRDCAEFTPIRQEPGTDRAAVAEGGIKSAIRIIAARGLLH